MTGAAVPPAEQAEQIGIVPVELTDAGVHQVAASPAPPSRAGAFVAPESVRAGGLVLRAGQRLTVHPGLVGRGRGQGRPIVAPRPRVLVLATGDELVPPGEPLRPGQLYESNSYSLAALVEAYSAMPVRPPRAPDDAAALAAVLAEHLDEVDLIVTSGG